MNWVSRRRGVSAVCALAVCGAAFASPVSAQDITVTLSSIGDRTKDIDGEVAVGVKECVDGDVLTFELTQVPTDQATIDIYEGSTCNDTMRNDPESDCVLVRSEPIEGVDMTIELSLTMLAEAIGLGCESGSVTKPSLWFLAVGSEGGNEDVGSRYGKFPDGGRLPGGVTEFRIDTDPPRAPTSVSGGTGERQIPVTWKSTDEDVDDFLIYVDSSATMNGDAGGDCGSAVLMQGASVDELSSVKTVRVQAPTARSHDLEPSDLDGDFAAIGVVAVDEAGNSSELSNIDCVAVVPTDGFWDLYRAQGGQAKTGCAMHQGRAHGSAWALPLLALLVLGLRRWRLQ